jgi:hypothetical protein
MKRFQHRRTVQLSETHYLLLGVGASYLAFVIRLGMRPMVLLIGAVISIGTIIVWYWQLHRVLSTASADLLQPKIFLHYLRAFESQIPHRSKTSWETIRQQSQMIQQLATQTAQRDPTLIPELLETLHTILALVEKIVYALQALQQVETYLAQQRAEQKLRQGAARLQESHQSLQELHDQLALQHLESDQTCPSAIDWLQILIAANQAILVQE